MPFEIDRTAPMWENYKQDAQTQVVSAFGGISATDDEVVATYAAMKSGLKVLIRRGLLPSPQR